MPSSNTGTLSVSSLSVAGPARNANLTDAVTVSFSSATGYTITDATSGASASGTYTPGQPIAFNGWSLTLLGAPQSGDSVNLGPERRRHRGHTNALALAQLQNASVIDGNSLGLRLCDHRVAGRHP